MKLALFRHAERENSGVSNPPLSPRGMRQSELLTQLVLNNTLIRPTKLYCSPKLRAVLTFQSLHLKADIELTISPELDERSNSEVADQFSKRVKQKLFQLTKAGPLNSSTVLFLCSHLDWIDEAMIHIPCDTDLTANKYSTWSPGSYMLFDVGSELWHLEKWEELHL
jgi:phosphohistidine phosphatase SixA